MAVRRPRKILDYFLKRNAQWFKDDKQFLSLRFWCNLGYWMDWENPQTFSEKMQWLKVYNRKNEYTKMVDKVEAKKYVADIIGKEYIIPTLGVWERAEDIDFDQLPNRFVLKCNHNSGRGMCICTDKSKLDIDKVRKELNTGLKSNYYLTNREWPYKDVHRRIIAEQYMEDYSISTCDLTDYKFFCFNGEPKFCQVINDRSTKETIDFFDMNWQRQEFIGLNPAAGPAAVKPEKPEKMELIMLFFWHI